MRHFLNACFYLFLCIILHITKIEAQFPTKPLPQMEIAFIGNPSQAKIKVLLDKAMKAYKLPITDENYSGAGDVLVTLRKDLGVSEMDILRYMVKSHVQGVKMKFPEAAALSAVFLKTLREK